MKGMSGLILALLVGVGLWLWKREQEKAEAIPLEPGVPTTEPPYMAQPRYFPPQTISTNQVQHIWIELTDDYSYRSEVRNPVTGSSTASSGALSPDPGINRTHFNYLTGLPTLSDVNAGVLGAEAAIFGFA